VQDGRGLVGDVQGRVRTLHRLLPLR